MRRENYEAQYNYVLTKSSVTVSFYACANQQITRMRISSDHSSISSNSERDSECCGRPPKSHRVLGQPVTVSECSTYFGQVLGYFKIKQGLEEVKMYSFCDLLPESEIKD